ncbi:MAG TPA: hypothetical protein V6D09_16290 [Leptolyngbyaceae cyanobacterium]
MNKKLKIALIHGTSEQGFAMPIVIGMGLIRILIGATMIVRSQGDQTTASAQKATARSLGTAETGITRVQAFLNKYPYFIKFPSTRWTDSDVINGAANTYIRVKNLGCSAVAGTKTSITADLNALLPSWKSVDPPNTATGYAGDPNKGEFQIRSYVYNTYNGTLTIDGRNPQGASTALQVIIPAVAVPSPPSNKPSSPPGLFLNKSLLTSNQTVNGNVWLNGCNDDESAPLNFDGTSSPTRQTDLEAGGIFTVSPTTSFPTLPALPSVAPTTLPIILTKNYYIDRYNPDSGTAATLPATLPTPADITNYPNGTQMDGSYAYRLSSITSDLSIALGKNVTIYLTGNISLEGSETVGDTIAPRRLKIFGSQYGAYCPNGLPNGTAIGCNTNSITLKGTPEINAYIFAPGATAGLDGGGSPKNKRFQGALWVKEWEMDSNSNKTAVTQTINSWSDFSWDDAWTTTRIAPISSWQRLEAP